MGELNRKEQAAVIAAVSAYLDAEEGSDFQIQRMERLDASEGAAVWRQAGRFAQIQRRTMFQPGR